MCPILVYVCLTLVQLFLNTFPGVSDTHPCVANTRVGVSNTLPDVCRTQSDMSNTRPGVANTLLVSAGAVQREEGNGRAGAEAGF